MMIEFHESERGVIKSICRVTRVKHPDWYVVLVGVIAMTSL